jgi:hypothetical protein
LPAALDVASHGDTGGFDLPGRDPGRFHCHDSVLSKRDPVALGRFALHAAAMHFSAAFFYTLWH